MPKKIITQIVPAINTSTGTQNTFTNENGTFYDWALSFADGTGGVYTSKANPQTKFVVGTEYDLEIIPKPPHPDKIKPAQNPQYNQSSGGSGSGGGNTDDQIRASVAAKLAITLAIAKQDYNEVAMKGDAELWYHWMRDFIKPTPAPAQATPVTPPHQVAKVDGSQPPQAPTPQAAAPVQQPQAQIGFSQKQSNEEYLKVADSDDLPFMLTIPVLLSFISFLL